MSGKILFACSKCFSRHPFEELSTGQQLCKDCRVTIPIYKCTYCRSEYQHTGKGSSSGICRKCEQNVKQYGKPSACECCSIIAAFIGSKCQRCANSELKYGPPVSCDQCKQRCAFDRHDENKKIDGKLLCWLCTQSYKRALVKARQVEKESRLAKKRPHNSSSGSVNDKGVKENSSNSNSSVKKPTRSDINKQSSLGEVPEKISRPTSASDKLSGNVGGNNSGSGAGSLGGLSGLSGLAITGTGAAAIDTNNSDHVVAMTQLKEQIASLQKRLQMKDKELLEKDKMITELKGKNFSNQNELRSKMKENERLYDMKVEVLNKKVASLLKEVATLKKGAKKNGTTMTINSGKDSGKDSGGSGTESPITN